MNDSAAAVVSHTGHLLLGLGLGVFASEFHQVLAFIVLAVVLAVYAVMCVMYARAKAAERPAPEDALANRDSHFVDSDLA